MAFVNLLTREVVLKIAYHGPGLGGKTTNLRAISEALPADARGELLTLDTATERTLFFDFLLVRLGDVAGFKVNLHLYTVPGQMYYGASRKLILRGVDVLVFVVDSRESRMPENDESHSLIDKDFREIGIDPAAVPLIVQYNKRDLVESLPLEELQARFNAGGAPFHEAIARHGIGVIETLRTAVTLGMKDLVS